MPTTRSYHSYLIESLKNPQEAAAYLEAVLEDGSFEEIRLALRNITEAQIAVLQDTPTASSSEETQKMLSNATSIDVPTLLKMLDKLGFRLSITPKKPAI